MINGIKPKVTCCSKCSSSIPTERLSMGYTICTNCSTEEKKVGHIIYPHKTGAYIQVMDKDTHKELNKLDRRGYKGKGGYKHYKELTISSSSDTNSAIFNPAFCIAFSMALLNFCVVEEDDGGKVESESVFIEAVDNVPSSCAPFSFAFSS